MTDMDFDELDRAVNSIMAGGTRPVPASRPESATVQPPSTALPPVSQSTASPVQVQASSSATSSDVVPSAPNDRAKSSVSIPSRRSGRFMDVVHPSATMRSASGAATKSVSRNAGTIEPIDVAVQRPTPDLEELNDLLSSANEAQFSLDDHAISPFITDAKVDKRPLGASENVMSAGDVLQDESAVAAKSIAVDIDGASEAEGDKDEQLAPEAPAPTEEERRATMPAELNPDVLSIETALESEAQPHEVEKAQPPTVQAQKPQPTRPSPQPVAPRQTTSPVSAGSIAIQQQYTSTEPTVEPDTLGSIYDTDTYHQPLLHPEQKKSGWSWVVWVVILLILGAGGGALAYYLLIQ